MSLPPAKREASSPAIAGTPLQIPPETPSAFAIIDGFFKLQVVAQVVGENLIPKRFIPEAVGL
jgi:hypothetical protein